MENNGESTKRPEQASREPVVTKEPVQFMYGHLAQRINGEPGAKFEFGKKEYRYDPLNGSDNAGIVRTVSGEEYYIGHGRFQPWEGLYTYVVDVGETEKQKKLVAAYSKGKPVLPPVEFGKEWEIPGFLKTAPVETVFLDMKKATADPETKMGREIPRPDPHWVYYHLLEEYQARGIDLAKLSQLPTPPEPPEPGSGELPHA